MPKSRNGAGFDTRISRRTFNKVTVGAGAALAMGNILPACSGSAPSSSPKTEIKTLHFDLSVHPEDSIHELRAMGKRYTVASHTPATLQQATYLNPDLTGNAAAMTHYAADVVLSADKPHLFSLTTHHPQRGASMLLVAFHIPSSARSTARSKIAKQTTTKYTAAGVACSADCALSDEFPDEFITVFDAAKAIVMHHPEIINLNSDIAAQVEAHINNSAEVKNLALSICCQGPAYRHDPAYYDGWCVLVPLTNQDGTPKLDKSGQHVYDYKFSDKTSEDLKPAVRDVLSRIKNDPDLRSKMYAVHPHGATEDDGVAAKVAARYRLWKSGGVEVAATKTGYHHNVCFQNLSYTGSGSTRSISLNIINQNFIWYGIYLEYLDASGKPLSNSSLGSLFTSIVAGNHPEVTWDDFKELTWLESDTVKWVNIIASPPTIFGVPIYPWPTEVNVTMPEGASSVRVMLCGPGYGGKVDHGGSLIVGCILTLIMQYALPGYFIYSGKGINEDGTLWGFFKANPGVLLKVLVVVYSALNAKFNQSSAHNAALYGSIEALLAATVEEVIILISKGALPKITEWAAKKTGEEEAEDAVPFVGWVVRVVTLTGTLYDIAATSAEIHNNPLVIDNVISFTAPVAVTVNCDPGNYQFPEEATYYDVQFIVTGATYPENPQGFALDQSVRGKRSFSVTIDGVPTTGRNDDTVHIRFYDNSGRNWLAGEGKATFRNNPAADGSITATVTIAENPIPLTATTVYSQHRKLEYLGGKYVWNEDPATLQVPAVETTACGAGLCELTNISVWVPGGMLGYSWMSGGRHFVKNVNAQEADPNPGMKYLNSGIGAATPVAYDKTATYTPANMTGDHFYLDPVNISIDNPAYYLRKLNLDPASGIFKTNESWGRFPLQLDRLAVHPNGYVIGISANNHKMAVLQLPDQAYADDATTNNAVLKLGYGDTEKLVKKPQALTISRTGAILILQGESSIAVKAFDVSGNPWPFFNNGTASSFPLAEPDAKWLDIAIDDTEMLFILSYTGTGMMKNDYRLDVYDKTGSRVFRNTGVSVARMVVDKWRRVYSLNQETMKNSHIVEPTVSVWMPSVPQK